MRKVVVIGPGSIGQAIARRVGAGKHLLLADLRQENADAAAKTLSEAGFEVTTMAVDVSSRDSVEALVAKASALGDVHGVIHAAGVSPSQASPETILKVDLYGTALILEEFGKVIAEGGAGVVIASQSGHRLPTIDRAEPRAGHDAGRGAAQAADAAARRDQGFAARLPSVQARKFLAGHVRGCPLGQARRAHQHHQPRHHHDASCEGRADKAAWRGLSAHDRRLPSKASRHPGRGSQCRAAAHGKKGRLSPEATS